MRTSGTNASQNDGPPVPVRQFWARSWLEQRQGRFWGLTLRSLDSLQLRLSQSAFTRNVSVLLISTILGQAAGVLLSPFLTRIFSPEEFAMLSVFSSILGIAGSSSCLRYEITIPLARDDTEAANLIVTTGLSLVLFTAVFTLGCWLVPSSFLGGIAGNFETTFRLLLPIGLFVLGFYTVLLYTATWANSFNIIARARISQGVGGPLSQIGMGLLGMGSTGLALGFIIGQTAGMTLLFRRMVIDRWSMLRLASVRGVKQAIWANRAYPLITAWATVVDSLGSSGLLYLCITQYYPGPVAGYLFLAERVVARPLVMISNSMLMVFTAELGQYKSSAPAKVARRFRQITSKQFLIGLAWVIVINLVSSVAFPTIFGDKWGEAVPYLLVISATHLATNVIQPVSNTLQSLNRQVLVASWQVGRAIFIYAGFAICHRLSASPLVAIEVYSTMQVVACIIIYYMIRSNVDRLGAMPLASDIS